MRRLVPDSVLGATAVAAAAGLVVFGTAFAVGRSQEGADRPLPRATPLVPLAHAVAVSGLPTARPLPALLRRPQQKPKPRPKPERAAPGRPKPSRPVVIDGSG